MEWPYGYVEASQIWYGIVPEVRDVGKLLYSGIHLWYLVFVERAAMHAMPHSYLETIQNLLTRSPFEPCHIYINPNKNRADSYAVLNVTYCVFFRKQQQPGNLVKSPKRTWKICASVGRMWMRRIHRPWHVTEMGSEDLVMRNSECL